MAKVRQIFIGGTKIENAPKVNGDVKAVYVGGTMVWGGQGYKFTLNLTNNIDINILWDKTHDWAFCCNIMPNVIRSSKFQLISNNLGINIYDNGEHSNYFNSNALFSIKNNKIVWATNITSITKEDVSEIHDLSISFPKSFDYAPISESYVPVYTDFAFKIIINNVLLCELFYTFCYPIKEAGLKDVGDDGGLQFNKCIVYNDDAIQFGETIDQYTALIDYYLDQDTTMELRIEKSVNRSTTVMIIKNNSCSVTSGVKWGFDDYLYSINGSLYDWMCMNVELSTRDQWNNNWSDYYGADYFSAPIKISDSVDPTRQHIILRFTWPEQCYQWDGMIYGQIAINNVEIVRAEWYCDPYSIVTWMGWKVINYTTAAGVVDVEGNSMDKNLIIHLSKTHTVNDIKVLFIPNHPMTTFK